MQIGLRAVVLLAPLLGTPAVHHPGRFAFPDAVEDAVRGLHYHHASAANADIGTPGTHLADEPGECLVLVVALG
jgi:hypothetical protein